MAATYPCVEQPCLHRVLADCPHDRIEHLAGLYGLLTATGKNLPPEPVDTWHREIRTLRNARALWDANRLGRKLAEHLARVPFHLRPSEENPLAFRYCPLTLSAALWQRFAAEVAGLLPPARCPAPKCGRWFLPENGRSDRRFCSNACKNRVFRQIATIRSSQPIVSRSSDRQDWT